MVALSIFGRSFDKPTYGIKTEIGSPTCEFQYGYFCCFNYVISPRAQRTGNIIQHGKESQNNARRSTRSLGPRILSFVQSSACLSDSLLLPLEFDCSLSGHRLIKHVGLQRRYPHARLRFRRSFDCLFWFDLLIDCAGPWLHLRSCLSLHDIFQMLLNWRCWHSGLMRP